MRMIRLRETETKYIQNFMYVGNICMYVSSIHGCTYLRIYVFYLLILHTYVNIHVYNMYAIYTSCIVCVLSVFMYVCTYECTTT